MSGPQIRMAPNPMRFTMSSPLSATVPPRAAGVLGQSIMTSRYADRGALAALSMSRRTARKRAGRVEIGAIGHPDTEPIHQFAAEPRGDGPESERDDL